MKYTKAELDSEIIRQRKLIEKAEKEIQACRIKQNQLTMVDLLQKKYHHEQQIMEMQEKVYRLMFTVTFL